jgi:alkanesulfonate monooxygenase SsuD/methylene tetrahydromethanopterin reductase-like flavin-dependent oxidoreductase (luciferase family)
MAPAFGVRWRTPLKHLREYLIVLRALLRDGEVDFEGDHVTARMRLARTVQTPIMASALRSKSFEACGELADGAISWNCPADFLEQEALPALRRGAERAGRAAPPLIAHVPICVSKDMGEVREAARGQLSRYANVPFYNAMFEAAGFPNADTDFSDGLIDALVVHGSEQVVAERLGALLDRGFGEILAMPLITGDDRDAAIERSFAAVARAARGK